ncbi:uncharacterized protein LOC111321268 [Stylophora pistillata]|uniref:uncharacterized protein LOC111321268 n=1 Tax=Stylophora pistillata TaxID=50429 RepID=UPI000C04F7C8|nr:uncharacterized protein LOC111321268 [Stylophora pistillata]
MDRENNHTESKNKQSRYACQVDQLHDDFKLGADKMAAGHQSLSSMELAILLLMTTLFLHGNVNTSSLILRRDASAAMEHWSLVVANTSLLNSRKTTPSRGHGKIYLSTRFSHTSNGTSSFHIYRLITGGDIHSNPRPTTKMSKHPCKECGECVGSNQDSLLCV